MRTQPATPAEVRRNFERVLAIVQDGSGRGCPTAQGFNDATMEALNAIALADKPTAVLIVAARTALAQQLNGDEAMAADADITRQIGAS